jgi:pimeloyl-ACP methyl ester carboxylesterase
LIRRERLLGAPNGAIAWRVLYHSRDVHGADIAVSGVVIAPNRKAPKSGWPVVAWAHPTTGSARTCAPSLFVDPFIVIEGLRKLIDDGYVVTATDYSGMGASGPQAYLVGTTEGNNVLDSVRAAHRIPEAGAGEDTLLWGHSQGGQAALFAAQDASTYAPELNLRGVAVAAPAVELGALLHDDIDDDSGVTIGAYAFDAYGSVYESRVDHGDLASVLTPAGVKATPKIADICLLDQKKIHAIAKPLVGRYLTGNPEDVEPWKSLLAENTPGGKRIGVPIFVAQGADDTLVHPPTTTDYVHRLCDSGEHVQYDVIPKTGHGLVALRAVDEVEKFFGDVTHDRPAPSNC